MAAPAPSRSGVSRRFVGLLIRPQTACAAIFRHAPAVLGGDAGEEIGARVGRGRAHDRRARGESERGSDKRAGFMTAESCSRRLVRRAGQRGQRHGDWGGERLRAGRRDCGCVFHPMTSRTFAGALHAALAGTHQSHRLPSHLLVLRRTPYLLAAT
ncbi:hypothetical protein C8T65DRAFT_647219 [Cerioporus squamosus]|nr:hypothetical protein C8T65DRAFT_647219 [Cerioporus squamosus]